MFYYHTINSRIYLQKKIQKDKKLQSYIYKNVYIYTYKTTKSTSKTKKNTKHTR